MSIVNTGVTRRILNAVINLHRRAVVAECEALDRRADGLFAAADQQKKVVAAEHGRLEAIRLDAVKAELANTKKSLDEAKTAGAASAAELEKANEQIAKLQAEISALKNRTTRGVSFGSPDYRGF